MTGATYGDEGANGQSVTRLRRAILEEFWLSADASAPERRGRLETVLREHLTVLDAKQHDDAVAALCQELEQWLPRDELVEKLDDNVSGGALLEVALQNLITGEPEVRTLEGTTERLFSCFELLYEHLANDFELFGLFRVRFLGEATIPGLSLKNVLKTLLGESDSARISEARSELTKQLRRLLTARDTVFELALDSAGQALQELVSRFDPERLLEQAGGDVRDAWEEYCHVYEEMVASGARGLRDRHFTERFKRELRQRFRQ